MRLLPALTAFATLSACAPTNPSTLAPQQESSTANQPSPPHTPSGRTPAPVAATVEQPIPAVAVQLPEKPLSTDKRTIKATAAMPTEGKLDASALLGKVNEQIQPLSRCVPLIRNTDNVVGSLNLHVRIADDGSVKVDLQSPVNKQAERCLVDGMSGWKLTGMGRGRAMVLLMLDDK